MKIFWKWLICFLRSLLAPSNCSLHSHRIGDAETCIGDSQRECRHCMRPVSIDEDSPYL